MHFHICPDEIQALLFVINQGIHTVHRAFCSCALCLRRIFK